LIPTQLAGGLCKVLYTHVYIANIGEDVIDPDPLTLRHMFLLNLDYTIGAFAFLLDLDHRGEPRTTSTIPIIREVGLIGVGLGSIIVVVVTLRILPSD
jgi:hypothetical protein